MINRLPPWFKQSIPDIKIIKDITDILADNHLNTICLSAKCPNQNICFKNKTATFLLLGNVCTRNCRFCSVKKGRPLSVDTNEPKRIAKVVKEWQIDYVVITSVTRDDLIDGGASQFVSAVKEIKKINPSKKLEVLIPDFQGNPDALKSIIASAPDIISHNLETVPRLYNYVRPKADYQLSLKVLAAIKKYNPKIMTKSAVMLGLGEKFCEVIEAMQDLKNMDCDILTLGQYLKPEEGCSEVEGFIAPEEFEVYKAIAVALGFKSVAAAPLVRSSYKAKELLYA